jgi:hypothetical protein
LLKNHFDFIKKMNQSSPVSISSAGAPELTDRNRRFGASNGTARSRRARADPKTFYPKKLNNATPTF